MDPEGRTAGEALAPAGVLTGARVAPEGESITIESGSGPYVTTAGGEEYLDYKLGSGPMIVGHAHPHVVDAVQERAAKGTTFYAPNTLAPELAERIVDAVPCADAIQFVSTGTEATYLALRTARAHTGRRKVLKFEGSYHGWHDAMLVSSNQAGDRVLDRAYPEGTVDTAGTAGAERNTLVAPFNDLDRTAEIVEEHADELAAVIAEPMMRTIPPADGFLEGVRDLCDEHGIVLVFDEVVTGFRLAWGGGQAHYGVEPDLATYGKAIGGGTPVAAVCGDRGVMDAMRPGLAPEEGGVEVRGTLNGNPLGMAAGLATLDVLERDGTYRDLRDYGDRLRGLFADVLADSPLEGVPVGDGPVADYALTEAPEVTDWRTYLACDSETKAAIDAELFDRGVLKSAGGKMYVSTEHGDAEFERTAEAVKRAFERVDG